MEKEIAESLNPRKHFELLDGLRGVAAIVVVIFHFMEFVYTDYTKNFIGHGFLAVDFFFCLSGFVIGYAYDERIGKTGIWQFFKSRLIRLHPLVLVGSLLGLLAFLYYSFKAPGPSHNIFTIGVTFLGSIFMIPLPIMPERGYSTFGFNAPAWSLFFEYLINIIYAVLLWRINKKVLLVLTVLSAVALGTAGFNAGTLLGGWDGKTFLDGCARVSYSFLAGLLVFRFNWIIKNNLGFGTLAILLLAAFMMPYVSWNWLAETLVIVFYFPLLVALGAGVNLSGKIKSVCTFLGDLSYPIYMTHYATLWFFAEYYNTRHPGTLELSMVIGIGTLLLIGFAYLMMLFYDIPLRKYLTAKRTVNR